MEVSGQLHDPDALPLREKAPSDQIMEDEIGGPCSMHGIYAK
jgi:hypothetical protein